MPLPSKFYLTVAQTEELLDILVPMAGGIAGYTPDGRRSSYVFPGGLNYDFVGNENVSELASSWGLDIQSLSPSLSVLDGIAHMQSMHACSDALFKAIADAPRSAAGYVNLGASLAAALNSAGVSLSLIDPPEQYWAEVLSVPSVRARLESTWTYPHDGVKRTEAVNSIMSVLGAMGIDIYQPDKVPRASKQIVIDKRQDPSNPYRITDVSMLRDSLFKMAEKSLLGGLGSREFIKNVHHQCYARNIALSHQNDLKDSGGSSTHPAFMTMQSTRALMQCYAALSQGQVETANQSLSFLEGVERPLGRSYLPQKPLSSMREHLANRAYSLSRVFNDRSALAKGMPSQDIAAIHNAYASAEMALKDAMSASPVSLVTVLSNLEAMNVWANPGLYQPNPSLRQEMFKKASVRVSSLEGNWAGALLNQQHWERFASQSRENHQTWLSCRDELKSADPMLFSRMQEDWDAGYRGDSLLLGLDIGKATTVQKSMFDAQLDSLKAEIAFKTRGLWQSPEVLPSMIEFARESTDWTAVVEQMTSSVPTGDDYRESFHLLVRYHSAAVKTVEFVRDILPGIVERKTALLAAQQLAEQKSVAPAVEKPAETKPATPVAEKPAETKPATPVAEKPAETKPATPVAEKPAETKPAAPVAAKPAETKPATPVAAKPAETKPATPVAAKPAETKPAAPVAAKPAETKPAAPVAAKPAETKPATPVAAKPAETKPAAPVAAKPAETKPATPVAAKPAETKPAAPVAADLENPVGKKWSAPVHLPVALSDDPKTAMLQIYEKVTELAFNKEGDLVAADELDWFSAVWNKVVGDLDAMTPESIASVYPEAMASFGHMMQFKARPALHRWYDESSEKSLQIEGFSELSKKFDAITSTLPSEQSDILNKVWKTGLRHVIRDDGQVPEYVAMEALSRGVSAAELWVQSLRKADTGNLSSEYRELFSRFETAAKGWESLALGYEPAAPALSVHWDLAIQSTMWFSLPKIEHGIRKLEAVLADPAMQAQIMKFDTDTVSTSPWTERPGERNLRPSDVVVSVEERPVALRNDDKERERRPSMSM